MGKKVKWFSSVKKALNPESKNKDQRAGKSKKKWFRRQKHHSFGATSLDNVLVLPAEEDKINEIDIDEVGSSEANNDYGPLSEANHDEQSIPPTAVEVDKSTADETDVLANGAASEVVQVAVVDIYAGKMNQEAAAIKIQTAYRGYMARRALRALRGLVRLESLVQGPVVRRQANNTLRCMQTLARVQSQIRSRRIRMSEDNQALKRKLLEKQAMEIDHFRIAEEWNDSVQSKEQIEASLIQKKEAAMRRERALAYAFSHQQNLKNSAKTPTTMFMDTANPAWGWSWLERWMAARPWESHSVMENELKSDVSSLKNAPQSGTNGEIRKAYAQFHLNSENAVPNQSANGESHTTCASTAAKEASSSSKAGKLKPAKRNTSIAVDDSKSPASAPSERNRRRSFHGSSARDDDSQGSSPSLRSYMVPTESAKAKSRWQRRSEKDETRDQGSSPKQLKKRLSYPASPARPRRHSGPPRVSNNSIK